MGEDRDLRLAKKFAKGAKEMMGEYFEEMRRQGRIKGKLTVTIRNGRKKIELPYRGPGSS